MTDVHVPFHIQDSSLVIGGRHMIHQLTMPMPDLTWNNQAISLLLVRFRPLHPSPTVNSHQITRKVVECMEEATSRMLSMAIQLLLLLVQLPPFCRRLATPNTRCTFQRLDEMVSRVLAAWYHLGQDSVSWFSRSLAGSFCSLSIHKGYPPVNFDAQLPDGSGPLNLGVSVRSPAHIALVREIASASAVLLKNNRTTSDGTPSGTTIRGLPVAASRIKSIAVVGQDAKMPNLDCNDLNQCNDGTMSIGCARVCFFFLRNRLS